MSAYSNLSLTTRPFNGWDDPSLPLGYWVANTFLTGTASGGEQTISVIFSASATPLNSNFYSLEQLTLQYVTTTARPISVRTGNMDMGSLGGAVDMGVIVQLVAGTTHGGIAMMSPRDAEYFKGIWLGSPRLSTADAKLTAQADNTNGAPFVFAAQGYYWGPRSILTPGGPQRPVRGMYKG